MKRREFITLLSGAAAPWPLAAGAQQLDGKAHVGVLGPNPDVTLASIGYRAFTAELQKLGFSQGKTFSSIIAAPIKAWNALLPERESLSLQRARSLSPSDRKYHCGRRLPRIPDCRS